MKRRAERLTLHSEAIKCEIILKILHRIPGSVSISRDKLGRYGRVIRAIYVIRRHPVCPCPFEIEFPSD